MDFGLKIIQIFKEIIKLLTLVVWRWSFKFIFLFTDPNDISDSDIIDILWILIPLLVVIWLFGWFCRLFNVPPLSLLYKPNKNYGNLSSYERRITTTHDVYNSSGSKVGSLETDHGTERVYTEDDRKYVPRYLRMFLYFFYFPINRVLALMFSIVALFTEKFYVASNNLGDISGIKEKNLLKYNRTLYTLFNIVYERSPEKVEKLEKKLEEEKAL